jgi:tRNA A37 methylthiotransferase MiaB
VAIRTSFIAGFPGETDADFETLCQFVEGRPSLTGSASFPIPTKTPAEASRSMAKWTAAPFPIASAG